jgi:predicted GNAT family N-acyltransferase
MSRTDSIFVARAKTPEEREACFAIRREVFVGEQKVPPEYEYDDHDKVALHFLALHEKKPVGTARVVFKDGGSTAKIGRVAVLKKARGLGTGRAIMQAIEADSDVRQAATFFLESQTYAIPFYERLGYAAYGDEYLDCNIPHRFMSKNNSHTVQSTGKRTA